MRLAVVVNQFPVLSESFIVNKVIGLRSKGVDVTVIAHSPKSDLALYTERFTQETFPPRHLALTSLKPTALTRHVLNILLHHPQTSYQLWRTVRQKYNNRYQALRTWLFAIPLIIGRYDIIHFAYSGIAVSYLEALPLLVPAKLITSCRGAAEQIMPLHKPERANELKQLLPQMDRIHCVSADMAQTVQRYGARPEQIFINHPSIDPARFQREQPYALKTKGPYHLISVGRLHWKKGLEYGLLAVRQLIDAGYDVVYDIIGGGESEESLRFATHDLGLQAQVQWHGRQSATVVKQKLEQADVYLLPSLSEGLSNAALEAMSMGLPLVSTTAGGMAEAITEGVEGFLVPSRDAVAMAQATSRLLVNPQLRQQMGQAGRQRIESQFYLQRQIDCFLQEYKTLLQTSNIETYA